MRRLLLIVIAAVLALTAAAPALHAAPKRSGKAKPAKQEQAAKPRVVVLAFDGKEGEQVRKWVVAELKQLPDNEVVSDKRARAAGKPQGDEAVEAARKLEAAALLGGTVATKKNSWQLKLVVINGADGEVVEELEFKGKNKGALKDDISQNLVMRLADPLARSKVPEKEPEPEPEKPAAEEEEEKKPAGEEEAEEEPEQKPDEEEEPKAAADEGGAARPSPLEIGLGIRGYSRNFDYNEDLFQQLRTHKVEAAPSVFIYARWYPLAHGQGGMLANLGVTGGYEQGFATTTEDADGRELTTSTNAFYVGVRGRLPLDRNELGLVLSYGQHNFGISGDTRPFPDVGFKYLGVGLDGRFRFGSILLGFHAAHRQLLGTGELESAEWFPHVSGAGFVGGVYGGQALSEQFDLVAGFDIHRYYLDMNAVPGDRYAVGGAVDQYLSLFGGVIWHLPGSN
jgi:hypothetical protein